LEDTGENLKSLSFATWNILGDDLDRLARLTLIANEIKDLDFVAIQEVVLDEKNRINTALALSDLSGLKIASCVSGEITNLVTGQIQGTAILTKLEVVISDISIPAPPDSANGSSQEYKRYAAAILRAPNNRLIFVCSVHLPWGAHNEVRRLEHSLYLDMQITEIMQTLPADSISILAGDFNTNTNSESLRFLQGETAYSDRSTFWVDVWTEKGEGPGFTFDPSVNNPNLNETAKRSGIISPELMPPRRLDFLLLKGWVFGRAGSPLRASLLGNKPNVNNNFASDHFGVKGEIWNPD
jgi:endonuclease/exonuclease/phosphatase family metal-dependent hydrolase